MDIKIRFSNRLVILILTFVLCLQSLLIVMLCYHEYAEEQQMKAILKSKTEWDFSVLENYERNEFFWQFIDDNLGPA